MCLACSSLDIPILKIDCAVVTNIVWKVKLNPALANQTDIFSHITSAMLLGNKTMDFTIAPSFTL